MVTIVLPHQLFKENKALQKGRKVIVVEEHLYFTQFEFHQQKIAYHRATMRWYADHLRALKFDVQYIDAAEPIADIRALIKHLSANGIDTIHCVDPVDDWLERRMKSACRANNVEWTFHPTPMFLNKMDEVAAFFDKKKTYFQTDFYIWQRKERKILLEDAQPMGGKWSFDADNRERFPKQGVAPVVAYPPSNPYIDEAIGYVQSKFSKNYGDAPIATKMFPTNFKDAERWLDDFIRERFEHFGVYEDAMVIKEHFLHHSALTPMLNVGLLTPAQVIEKVLAAAAAREIPLNSLEGFIRQIIGWREFIRIVYEREGRKQRTLNYWGFTRKIPPSFWKGETGIVPVDVVIKKLLDKAYSHHIERLMVMGNFMILCEFDPNQVYKWFMELYIDAYDWVMVPNVYGMTQFADGGLMTTKPYISGSNYLMKMGDWPKGDWQKTWDGLFWRFMHVHRDFFTKNPRLGMLVKSFDKMSAEKKKEHLDNAEKFLASLDEQNKLA
jgi:deoxyribodipyrimidine photolyase-related protein